MKSTTRNALAALLAVLALLAAACGDDDDAVAVSGAGEGSAEPSDTTDGDGGDDAFPVTVTVDGVDTTVEAEPAAIVSLSPAATEMLFGIGAGDQVVAVDAFSNHPEEAPTTDLDRKSVV